MASASVLTARPITFFINRSVFLILVRQDRYASQKISVHLIFKKILKNTKLIEIFILNGRSSMLALLYFWSMYAKQHRYSKPTTMVATFSSRNNIYRYVRMDTR